MGDVGILGSDIEARYEDDKDRKYKRGRNKRRYRNVLQKVVTPLLLLASFFLPFSFLLISERGTRLPSNARSYTIEKPLIKEDSLRIASTASKGSRGGTDARGAKGARSRSRGEPRGSGSKSPKSSPDRAVSNGSEDKGKDSDDSGKGHSEGDASKRKECTDPEVCPIIRSLSVPNGPTAGGTVVTINGDNFGLPTSLKSILIGETPCSEIESLSTKQVSCMVPPGTGYDLPVTVRINELEGQSDSSHGGATWSYDGPQVRKVEPNHASGKGGALIALRGLNFGAHESHPIVDVGGQPCLETKWVSDQTVTCLVPPGRGTQLPVKVTVCGCGDLYQKNQTSDAAGPAKAASAGAVTFSYDEDIMKDNSDHIMDGIDLKKMRRVAVALHAQLVNLKYEMTLPDVVTGEMLYFAVIPEILSLLPPKDERKRHDTCAIVGSSGSLLDAQYGDAIDEHDAVYRLHNAPTHTFEAKVGAKTTYQVLNQFWAEELLKGGEKASASWVHESANLVLWSPYSQEAYLELREKFPGMSVTLMNPQFTQSAISAVRLMQRRVEEVMGTAFMINDFSSTLVSVSLAMEVCGKVDLYGVDMRYGKYLYYESHEVDTSEREASSLEYMIFLVLKAHGLIASINEGAKDSPAGPRKRGRDKGLPPLYCERKECRMDCNNQGIFANGTCLCDPVYSGPDCSVNRLELEATKILSGLNLTYGGALVINRKEVNGTKIALPEGITRNKFGKDGDVYNVDRMLYHVIPEEDTKQRYATCAIVGNSGSMLNHEYGHDIDAHEMVYRFNQAPTKGYEAHVGTRSTHESLNGYWVKQVLDERWGFKWNWRSRDTEMVVFELFEPGAFGWKAKSQIIEKDQWWRQSYVRLKQKHQGRKIFALSPYFVSWSYQMYRDLRRRFQRSRLGRYPGEKPMSGFHAFFFALQVCDKVDIYEFAPWRDPNDKHLPKGVPILSNDKYHYFDSARPRPGSHSFDLALYIYKLFAIHFDNVRIFE